MPPPLSIGASVPETSGGLQVPLSVACGDFGKRREDRTFTLQGDIAQRDEARHPFLPVEHRKVMHLALLHLSKRLLQGLVLETEEYTGRHHRAACQRIEAFARGHAAAGDVAIRDHAYEPIVLADRHAADTFITHDARDFLYRRIGGVPTHFARHRFLYQHGSLHVAWSHRERGRMQHKDGTG